MSLLEAVVEKFRQYLKEEYHQRSTRNPRYSMRAYAKHLGINHATLSGIFGGKRKVTLATLKKIAPHLGLGPFEIAAFNNKSNSRVVKYETLDLATFKSMAEWHYDAILELSQIPRFRMKPHVIATALDISTAQASEALRNLKKLGLLKLEDNALKAVHANSTNILDMDATSAAQRQYQNSILEKSLKALNSVPRKIRDHTSTTIAIDQKDVAAAKVMIQQFRGELAAFLQRDPANFNTVYQVQISFFPLTATTPEEQK